MHISAWLLRKPPLPCHRGGRGTIWLGGGGVWGSLLIYTLKVEMFIDFPWFSIASEKSSQRILPGGKSRSSMVFIHRTCNWSLDGQSEISRRYLGDANSVCYGKCIKSPRINGLMDKLRMDRKLPLIDLHFRKLQIAANDQIIECPISKINTYQYHSAPSLQTCSQQFTCHPFLNQDTSVSSGCPWPSYKSWGPVAAVVSPKALNPGKCCAPTTRPVCSWKSR